MPNDESITRVTGGASRRQARQPLAVKLLSMMMITCMITAIAVLLCTNSECKFLASRLVLHRPIYEYFNAALVSVSSAIKPKNMLVYALWYHRLRWLLLVTTYVRGRRARASNLF